MTRYLFGQPASLADFDLFGQLSSSGDRSDADARSMRKLAPFTDHWVRRLDDASGRRGRLASARRGAFRMAEALADEDRVASSISAVSGCHEQAFAKGVERLGDQCLGVCLRAGAVQISGQMPAAMLRSKFAALEHPIAVRVKPVLERTAAGSISLQ